MSAETMEKASDTAENIIPAQDLNAELEHFKKSQETDKTIPIC